MSTNGNGHADVRTPQRFPSFADMSSAQRSASMDATVQRVAELSAHHNQMAATIRLQGEAIDALKADCAAHGAWHLRLTSCFLARLRWLVRGA